MREHLGPARLARIGHRSGDQAEVAPAVVGANVEEVAAVIHIEFVVVGAWLDQAPFPLGLTGRQEAKAVFAELTRREVEVLELLASGLKNRVIADRLCLSEKTVKAHIGGILRKLHVNDRTEAALIAQRHGLTS